MPTGGARHGRGRNDRDNRGPSGGGRRGSVTPNRGKTDERRGAKPGARGGSGGANERPRSRKPQDRLPDRDLAGPSSWGRIARRGAGNLNYDDPETVAKPPDVRRREAESEAERPPRPPPDRKFPGAADLERTAAKSVKRARSRIPKQRKALPARPHAVKDPAVALRKFVGEVRAKSLHRRLKEAAKAFELGRYRDARGQLTPIVTEAPELPEGRELMGLAQYRLGEWKAAVDNLEAFRELSGSTEQHPVLADAYRALGRWRDVDEIWAELGTASPSAELVVEGRIVVAGAKADQGDLTSAIRILEQSWRVPKKPQAHHLRRAYALADLYDRAGRAPRARELFKWVAKHDPDLADVEARVRTLG